MEFEVGVGISQFIEDGCCEFSLFEEDFHVQESDGHLRDLVGEFDNGMEVLQKVDKIQKLFVAY